MLNKGKGSKSGNCSRCGNKKEDNRDKQRLCKSCHNENMRNKRPKHSELSPLALLKERCRAYTRVYIKRGLIIKKPCCICFDTKSQAHHEDYSKPREIIWFCRQHHLEHHKKNTNAGKH